MKLENLIEEFLLVVEASGDVESKDTVLWNQRRLTLFTDFINEHHITDPLTKRAFLTYAVHLKTRARNDGRPGKLSVYYRRGCLQALRRFGYWLHQEGHTTNNLGDTITLPKLPRHDPPKAITPNDIATMIATCTTTRDKALLTVLRDTGCRACEIVGMRWGNLDLERKRILVTGKNDKRRFAFFTQDAADLVETYKASVPHGKLDPVWWGNIGHKNQRPLFYRGFHSLLARLARKAGVISRWNPHAWRHAFGKRMNRAGVSTLNLQAMMGHESPETTLIYSGLDPDDLQQVYEEHT